MAHTENTIQNRKNKHLSPFERRQIDALHRAGHSNRDIGRRLVRVHQTIANELKTIHYISNYQYQKVNRILVYLELAKDVREAKDKMTME